MSGIPFLTYWEESCWEQMGSKIKTGTDGNIERYKARLVAQGFTQQYRADYDETFSPIVGMESFRVLIALSVLYGFQLHHVDVQTAFLNGDLEEEVYMKQPKGYATEGKKDFVCKLKKCYMVSRNHPDAGMQLSIVISKICVFIHL